jgi:hypothetical protein
MDTIYNRLMAIPSLQDKIRACADAYYDNTITADDRFRATMALAETIVTTDWTIEDILPIKHAQSMATDLFKLTAHMTGLRGETLTTVLSSPNWRQPWKAFIVYSIQNNKIHLLYFVNAIQKAFNTKTADNANTDTISTKSVINCLQFLRKLRMQHPQSVIDEYRQFLEKAATQTLSAQMKALVKEIKAIVADFERRNREDEPALDEAWAEAAMEQAWESARKTSRERAEQKAAEERAITEQAAAKESTARQQAAVEEKAAMEKIWRRARAFEDGARRQRTFLSEISQGSRDRNIQKMIADADRAVAAATTFQTTNHQSVVAAERALKKMEAMSVNINSKPRL